MAGSPKYSWAAAASSDPGFEDLIHRAGTQATINLARKFGVDTGASSLQSKAGEVGLALGIASLTVEEQATTFATLANGGQYVTPHVIAQINDNGNLVPLKIIHRQVLTPAQAADVDYALSFDTNCNAPGPGKPVCGTAVPNAQLSTPRPTIGKTGTTDNFQSAFFLGAIPQYSLAVGMFTNQQNGKVGGESLSGLAQINGQGGGFGGAWPATIWQTFMQNEFVTGLPVTQLPAPDFNGFTKWVQVPKQPPKPKRHHDHNPGPNPNPNPSPFCKHKHFGCPPTGGPTPSTNPSPSPSPSPSSSAKPTPSPSAAPTAGPALGTNALGAALLLVAGSVRRPGGG